MPIFRKGTIAPELVTPKHSTAFGPLVSGTQIELGLLSFKAGEGARPHSHEHEQMIYVLSGSVELVLDGNSHVLGPGDIAHIPPNAPHATNFLDDSEVVSCKGIVNGVGHRI